jgi:hypothetical protein
MTDAFSQLQQMNKMLKNLDRWLDAAAAYASIKKFEPEVLLQARIAPDMFTLAQQIQAACDGVKVLAARLAGEEPPKHPDTETTLAELRTRIQTVLAYTRDFTPERFEGAATREVRLAFLPGKGCKGADWSREMNVPNTYFHFTMAYAILRHNGVPIGKPDFIGSLTLYDL